MSRSIMAVARVLSTSKITPQSRKARFVEMTIEPRSYRAATTWNKRSAPRLSMGR